MTAAGYPGDWSVLGDAETDDPLTTIAPVGGDAVGRGWRVRLHPGRRADAMDLFLDGREARVAGVYRDAEGGFQLGVVVGDDESERPLFFHPDEVEPLGPPRRVLVAGIGNIFLSDDGFGSEVARRLASEPLPPGMEVMDVGLGGMHLAYELLEPRDLTVLVDTTRRGGEPGTLYVVEPDLKRDAGGGGGTPDAHGMHPEAVFTMLRQLGASPGRVLVVGCEPEILEEGLGLSPPVAGAVGAAASLVLRLVGEELAGRGSEQGGPGTACDPVPQRR